MRLFIDESLSPSLATQLKQTGRHDAVHPLHVRRCGEPDHRVFTRSIAEDRVIIAQNARDFRKLAAAADLHPGLILLPSARAARFATGSLRPSPSSKRGATRGKSWSTRSSRWAGTAP